MKETIDLQTSNQEALHYPKLYQWIMLWGAVHAMPDWLLFMSLCCISLGIEKKTWNIKAAIFAFVRNQSYGVIGKIGSEKCQQSASATSSTEPFQVLQEIKKLFILEIVKDFIFFKKMLLFTFMMSIKIIFLAWQVLLFLYI